MSSENHESNITEATETTIEPTAKIPKVRSEAQTQALDIARARAVASRIETASLKRKERQIELALAAKTASERANKINSDYDALKNMDQSEEIPTSGEVKHKRRKPARRVIVTEVSSASEESDVEIVLPKVRRLKELPSQMQMDYRRSAAKMFAYD
jgi:hypothetical protein